MSPGPMRAAVPHALVAGAELEALTTRMRATVPGLEIVRDKAASRLMRVLNVVARLWCPDFLTRFTTVIGATIYVPAQRWSDAAALFSTFAHEWVHALRAQGGPCAQSPCPAPSASHAWARFQWSALYLFPQSLAVFALLAVLAWPFGAAWLWALVALAALAPWPAPFRVREELAAYVVTIRLAPAADRPALRAWVVDTLAGWSYYRAAWRRDALRSRLLMAETWPDAETRWVLGECREIRGGAEAQP